MIATVIKHAYAFYFEIEYDNGQRTLGALSSPLIEQHGQQCHLAFRPGDKVRLLVSRRHDFPSIVGAA